MWNGVGVLVGVSVTRGVFGGAAVGPQEPKTELLRGFGVVAAKSAALLSVSVHPPFARRSAVVVLGAGAGPAPS
jgi:hypothetical protein